MVRSELVILFVKLSKVILFLFMAYCDTRTSLWINDIYIKYLYKVRFVILHQVTGRLAKEYYKLVPTCI